LHHKGPGLGSHSFYVEQEKNVMNRNGQGVIEVAEWRLSAIW
jgi:hypothetical protein